ncbi:MAG: hypothetical protein RL264_2215 [Bacteroidota bacterium]|jgi:Fe2+ transport system protein FeoA
METTLATWPLNKPGKIVRIQHGSFRKKLYELGVFPGEIITPVLAAPLGDPLAINVSGSLISLRKEDACFVVMTEF